MNKALLDSVLQLRPSERAELLDVIYDSLDTPDPAIDQAWADEAEHRLDARKSGKTQPIPAEDVLGKRP
ncbi:MAG: addiction module protein [Phycisphaeraceae bacterium]|nr:addiction module protein [Phycisphaeraceae bacterium]